MDIDPGRALQAALIAALRGDGALDALVGGRVYDEPPQDVAMPYVALGEEFGQPAYESTDGSGFEVLVTIDTWSRSQGRGEVKDIMAAILAVLHREALLIAGHTLVVARLEFSRIIPEHGDETKHGMQRFQIVTCP